jgi:hypothetical protein
MRRRQLPPRLALDLLLSENEVCSWVGFSLRTLQRKRKDGSIVGIPWSANRYRFRKSEIERFIAATEKETVVRFGGYQHESASSADLINLLARIHCWLVSELGSRIQRPDEAPESGSRPVNSQQQASSLTGGRNSTIARGKSELKRKHLYAAGNVNVLPLGVG